MRFFGVFKSLNQRLCPPGDTTLGAFTHLSGGVSRTDVPVQFPRNAPFALERISGVGKDAVGDLKLLVRTVPTLAAASKGRQSRIVDASLQVCKPRMGTALN